MDEMLTEEGDTTMHNDEDQEVFECAVHDNACFDFMFQFMSFFSTDFFVVFQVCF